MWLKEDEHEMWSWEDASGENGFHQVSEDKLIIW